MMLQLQRFRSVNFYIFINKMPQFENTTKLHMQSEACEKKNVSAADLEHRIYRRNGENPSFSYQQEDWFAIPIQ